MENNSFEWDDEKAEINFRKHSVSFDEGATIFDDPLVATISDKRHSIEEQRFIAIGTSVEGNLPVVSYTEREEKFRLISCRKATRTERNDYENN
jgi:uncharacterized DUF497 family protein